jgi:hypothetical protein
MEHFFIDISFFDKDPIYKLEKQRFGKGLSYTVKDNGYVANVYVLELGKVLHSQAFPLQGVTETLNGSKFIPIYVDAYKEGRAYFNSEFAVSVDTLYRNPEDYLKNLHHCYYHAEPLKGQHGWRYYKSSYPFMIHEKAIREYGFYAGVIYEVEELKKRHPQLFSDFRNLCGLHKIEVAQFSQYEAEKEKRSKPTISAYAIMHVYLSMYDGQPVTQQNKKELASKYGYNSGEQLRNDFTKYQNEDTRLGINTGNRRSADTHLKRFEDILPLLQSQNTMAFDKASQDYLTLKEKYSKYY